MALVLICLVAGYHTGDDIWQVLAIAFLGANLVFPSLFWPFAHVWFGLGQALGLVTSRLLLSLVYFLLVTPIGIFRRLLGADPLHLKAWKEPNQSAFSVRDQTYRREDMERPY